MSICMICYSFTNVPIPIAAEKKKKYNDESHLQFSIIFLSFDKQYIIGFSLLAIMIILK